VKSYPNCRHIVPALETLARLQLQKGDAGVEKTIGELAKQPQEVDRAAVLRAKVLAKWGDHEKAIAELESMIKNAPDGSTRQREARLAKAESLVVLKKFAEAEADVRAVIKATPTEDYQAQSAAYNTLCDCLRAAGKPKDALYAYLHTDLLYSKDKEQHPRALANASQLFRELKRDDRADDLW
jgi:tetratricopeptide (TPR) repeat protein